MNHGKRSASFHKIFICPRLAHSEWGSMRVCVCVLWVCVCVLWVCHTQLLMYTKKHSESTSVVAVHTWEPAGSNTHT